MLRYEHVSCILCSKDRTRLRFSKKSNPARVWIDGAPCEINHIESVVTCENCGLTYVNPRLVKDSNVATYSFEQELAYFESTYDLRYRAYKDLVRRLPLWLGREVNTILDIGSGDGVLIEVARESGIETLGTEIRESLIQLNQKRLGKNAVIFQDESQLPVSYYDIVTMINVLEHLPNPVSMLQLALRVLKPGGILVVHVPDFGGIPARVQGAHWRHIEPLEHLYYFTFKTLRTLMCRVGFSSFARFGLLTSDGVKGKVQCLFEKVGLHVDNGLGVVARYLPDTTP